MGKQFRPARRAAASDPVLIERHRVDVKLAQIRVPQHCAAWQVVLNEPEPNGSKARSRSLEPVDYNHDVHVLMLGRRSPEKRLDSPPAVQPYLKRGSLKGISTAIPPRRARYGLALYRVGAPPNAG